MTQEQKDLLLKDLSARLPYGVKVKFTVNENIDNIIYTIDGEYNYICNKITIITYDNIKYIDNGLFADVKPYLFPLSSMTEEQKKEFFNGTPLEIDKYGGVAVKDDSFGNSQYTDLEIYLDVIDRLLKNHFDIRGLIPMGLANDATGLNIY